MNVYVSLLVFVFFIINPLAGILLGTCFLWNSQPNKRGFHILAWMLAIYLAFINATRIPISDMLGYKMFFLQAKDYSLMEYILLSGKEPIYSIINYVCYYFLFGNWTLYVIVVTLLYYLLINYSIIAIGEKYACSSSSIVVTLIISAFFFQMFIMVGHTIRQFLAEAFFVYYLVRKFVIKKSSWWVALFALGIHSTVLPLIGVTFLPQIKHTLTISRLIKGSCLIGVCTLLFVSLKPILFSIPFISYIYARIESDKLLEKDYWQVESGVGGLGILLMLSIVFMIFFIKNRRMNTIEADIVKPLTNNCLFLIGFLFVLIFLKSDYLSLRYFFYVYIYFILILVLFFGRCKNGIIKILKCLIVPVIVVYFMSNIDNGVFHFELSAIDFIFLPLEFYFFYI